MILNRLIVPYANQIRFDIEHHENDEKYALKPGERYYIYICMPDAPFSLLQREISSSNHFEFDCDLEYGEYIFEVGILNSSGATRVVLPALDERMRPLNQLLILRRVGL